MWFNLGKYGQVSVTGFPQITTEAGKVSFKYLEAVIIEAKHINKVPWCLDEWYEIAVSEILKMKTFETRLEYEKRMEQQKNAKTAQK